MNLPPVYSVMYGTVQVLRRLTPDEADKLRTEDADITEIEVYTEPSHFFPDCVTVPKRGLSRSLEDTTCLDCLQQRANDLAGWRWTEPHNAKDVAYLISQGIRPIENKSE